MRALLLATVAAFSLGGPAYAGVKSKAPEHKPCSVSVKETMATLGEGERVAGLSPALNPAQYLFLKTEGQKHSEKQLQGDGAIIAIVGKDFLALFTKGTGDDAKVCQLMQIPANFVAAIAELAKGGDHSDKQEGDKSKAWGNEPLPEGELRL